MRRKRSTPTVRIQSLARADTILQAIARSPDGRARLGYISKVTCLNKNTAFTLLETLIALQYALQDAVNREYSLGPRLFEFAQVAESKLNILTLARPPMLEIHGQTGESVSLAIPLPKDALLINTIEGTYGVRGARYQGRRVPYHAAAVGKVILAYLNAGDRERILLQSPLPKLTKNTITDLAQLAKEIKTIRRYGFALSIEEEEIGANAVAVPILTGLGEVLGAIAVWGPASRLNRSRLLLVGTNLILACGKLAVA